MDLVQTWHGANLYGCTPAWLCTVMRRAGIVPVLRYEPNKHGGYHRQYYWHPSDILRVRAEQRLRQMEVRRKFRQLAKARPTGKALSRAKALRRATNAESFRRKVLARLAARTAD